MTEFRIEAVRGDAVESWHRVSVAVVTADGTRVAWSGDPGFPTYLRSAAKPFQAIPLVDDGAVERFGISQQELAVICASHNGTRRQVGIVRELLERLALSERDLACGGHRPLTFDLAVRDRGAPPPRDEVPRTPIASNCSGKHAGMLALATHHGWPTDGYHLGTHPVQRRLKEEAARWAMLPIEEIGEAIDGCGVVCLRMPLANLARAFAQLGTSTATGAQSIREAMMAHPDLVGGDGRLDTAVMETWRGKALAKVGADGVYGVALPERGLGIGLKVEDGHARAAMVALVSVLQQLDLDPAPEHVLKRYATFGIWNTRNERVGGLHATGTLTFE